MIAAALAQRGYRLITDDVCAITLTADGVPIVHPDGRQLKLWAQAIEKLELEGVRGGRVRGSLEKFYVEPREATTEALPLGAVHAPHETSHRDDPGIERPNVVDAALVLRSNAYRPLLVARLEQEQHYLHAAAQISNKSGIFLLKQPLDFAAMPNVVSWRERHWRDIGVTENAT